MRAARIPLSMIVMLTCLTSVAIADPIIAQFETQFDKVALRTEYGEAIHFVFFEWTVNSMSVSTDFNGGRTASDINSTNRAYLFELLTDLYTEKSEPDDPKCVRTHVEATFFRPGASSVVKRGCLFPKDRPLSKKVLGLVEVADLMT